MTFLATPSCKKEGIFVLFVDGTETCHVQEGPYGKLNFSNGNGTDLSPYEDEIKKAIRISKKTG